jgi:hypothetical protein
MCVGIGAFSLVLGVFQRFLPPFDSLAEFISKASSEGREDDDKKQEKGESEVNGDGENYVYIENEALRSQRMMMEATQSHHDEL